MKKQLTYIFLPTEKEIESGDLVKLPNGKVQIMSENDMIDYLDSQSSATKPQYLYILSEEGISDGDWFIEDDRVVHQANSGCKYDKEIHSKVIATTDPELWDNGFPVPMETGIGKITPSDIEYIISLHNGGGKGVDVHNLSEKYIREGSDFQAEQLSDYQNGKMNGFFDGYNQCLTDNAGKEFTLEDMRKCWDNGDTMTFEMFIQSLKSHSQRDTIMVEYEEFTEEGHQIVTAPRLKLQGGCIVISRG